ncbi:alpha-D-ribose 1-methylphosphonate 5-triphosphate diphosphatase [Roseovarius faecimaris]|uniref:Alpha-D-ribose 1-methylphosphonate 5-triphosphate diphosphatase n=1 Tax=Roseovarius faecimaris TaxID=2494550 RepID=A0A6I6IZ29_9RHOB|nr:alpha-D-ribose 1-methylphosphonate 5-triphosphate diphosphatase [Roseovarius faecimaris]QGX97888.1 alpha-D-ribose 1-methylphosphonate 5-triphosphate diphosphatase [Roseovarius faecimaris]
MSLALRLTGAEVLRPGGRKAGPLSFAEGRIVEDRPGLREVDLRSYMILPGIVDIHGDGFERHLAPRRGAMKDLSLGLRAAEAEIAAGGITTAVLAQFYSWEGGMRGPEFAERVFAAIGALRDQVASTLLTQLRFEIPMLEDYGAVADMVARHGIGYVVFNDHLPHDELEKGKRPKRLTGQALRIGRNPEKHLEFMQGLHARMGEVPAALDGLIEALVARGVRLGSHDDKTASERETWRARGVGIAEFPETAEAVEAAHLGGDAVIMGAPNVVRGGSHNGNASAAEAVMMGYVDALASDYHYPSLRRAAFLLADGGVCDLATAWGLISAGPARVLGLTDRGTILPGQRADLVVMEPKSRAICATLSGGRVSYMSGDVAARFVG